MNTKRSDSYRPIRGILIINCATNIYKSRVAPRHARRNFCLTIPSDNVTKMANARAKTRTIMDRQGDTGSPSTQSSMQNGQFSVAGCWRLLANRSAIEKAVNRPIAIIARYRYNVVDWSIESARRLHACFPCTRDSRCPLLTEIIIQTLGLNIIDIA